MSLHKNPKYQLPELVQALKDHGLDTDTPSQLSDAFRTGWVAALVATDNGHCPRLTEQLEASRERVNKFDIAHTAQPVQTASLTDIDAIAKTYCLSYASPHHITFSVAGLRAMLEATQWARLQPVPPAAPEIVAWRREWNGDVSDENNWLFASSEEEKDSLTWEALVRLSDVIAQPVQPAEQQSQAVMPIYDPRMNYIENEKGRFTLLVDGLSMREIKKIFEIEYGSLMWSKGCAYPSDNVVLKFTSADVTAAIAARGAT